MTKIEVMQMALDALLAWESTDLDEQQCDVAVRALREELAKPDPMTFEEIRDGIANAAEDWPDNDYYPPTIAEMIRKIVPTPIYRKEDL